jgi:hypothetical protein
MLNPDSGPPASADAELEPPLREMIDRRHVLGETQRVASGSTCTAIDLDPACTRQTAAITTARTDRAVLRKNLGEPDRVDPRSSAAFICASDSSKATA